MKYPKKIMSRPDLIKMGFSETYLRRAFATPGQTFAWQDNPKIKNSPYYYDTEAFEGSYLTGTTLIAKLKMDRVARTGTTLSWRDSKQLEQAVSIHTPVKSRKAQQERWLRIQRLHRTICTKPER